MSDTKVTDLTAFRLERELKQPRAVEKPVLRLSEADDPRYVRIAIAYGGAEAAVEANAEQAQQIAESLLRWARKERGR